MQKRHLNRQAYFIESANTSRIYYTTYLNQFIHLVKGIKVLEVGCGEGGNILPFAEMGCEVTGIDMSKIRIEDAKEFFKSSNQTANFLEVDFFNMKAIDEQERYDVIIIHDVIEHIPLKDLFMKHLKQFLKVGGIVFWAFPAWQMPFGGHQQICRSKLCSRLPFIHLLPSFLYIAILKICGEKKNSINELMSIKNCKVTIEEFERLLTENKFRYLNRCLWLVNPHYEQKFNLKPRKLSRFISNIKYVRNFFSSSCFYVTKYA